MLETDDLRKTFGKFTATDGISVEFGQELGESVFIVGPNGAGKTTLINLMTGLLEPDSGSITLNGDPLTGVAPSKRVGMGLARSFQIARLFDEMTVRENVRTAVLSNTGRTTNFFSRATASEDVERRTDDLIDEFGFEEEANVVADELPHGDQKLLDVAMTFALEPKYLLLDEPTAGVTTSEKQYVIEMIESVSNENDVVTITIEHDMDIVSSYADRVVALHQGTILGQGPPSILETDDELRRVLLGVTE